jgi:hypothetical protein
MTRYLSATPVIDPAMLAGLKAEVFAWASQQIANGYTNAHPLSEQQSLIARRVGVVSTGNVRLIEIEKLSRPQSTTAQMAMQQTGLLGPGTLGLTLGYLVFVDLGGLSRQLLAHEFRHVAQFEQAGSLEAYLSQYIDQVLAFGYRQAPMEVDARCWELE